MGTRQLLVKRAAAGPGWRNLSSWRTIPPPMSLLAFLLVAQTATQDTVPPYLAFPEPGLDDAAAYEGYDTRVYQDASHNAFQVYLKGNTGRVVRSEERRVGKECVSL